MDAKNKFEEIATAEGWGFIHARRDFQNLMDAAAFVADSVEGYGPGETVMVLDPIKRRALKDGAGILYSGHVMILTKSDFDGTYDEKYNLNVAPLINKVMKELPARLRCIYDVEDWSVIEVINVFDFNADGLSVSFNLKFQ